MKSITTFLFVIIVSALQAQIASDCTIPAQLQDNYDRDVKGLAMKRMQAQNSPDNLLIDIPQIVQDSIYEGMAAILNTIDILPEADSVFNLYCVHDNFSSPAVFGMIIGVDTESPIATAWEGGNTFTGNMVLDTLLNEYGFVLQNYFTFGAGVLYSDNIWNTFALADSITNSVPGIEYVEGDLLIGGAGRIGYNTDESGNRYYEFRYEWNDCFDGCDNFYTWNFIVSPDCSVTFTGSDQGGVFGTEPLPAPTDCQLFTDTDNLIPVDDLLLFPNPGSDQLFWRNAPATGSWQLFNINGQRLQSGNWQEPHIDTQDLAPGVYWLQIRDNSGTALGYRKWIKQ